MEVEMKNKTLGDVFITNESGEKILVSNLKICLPEEKVNKSMIKKFIDKFRK
jgi:lauroyl/myristoyl acyltransferase